MISDLANKLGKINASTMTDVVEVRLREYLKKESFKPGDSLPSELEIANALGVSRTIVREALSRLRMLGMIESRKRSGMILTRPDILGAFEKVLDPLIIDDNTLQDIFEIRLLLEIGLPELLYKKINNQHIEELEEIAGDQIATDSSFKVNNEIAFHGKLYEITGNDTLKRFQILLLPIFAYLTTQIVNPVGSKVSHMDLVEILKHGTKEDFKAGMLAHLQPHFDRIK